MFPYADKRTRSRPRRPPVLPWVFILGIALGVVLAGGGWLAIEPHFQRTFQHDHIGPGDASWDALTVPGARHVVRVLRTLDGDTFVGRIRLRPDLELTTKVRLRGIDAPELNAACAQELQLAKNATSALKKLLAEGEATIFNIGPDRYAGRIVADVSTVRTANVSQALLEGGHARSYQGGRREGWCSVRGSLIEFRHSGE